MGTRAMQELFLPFHECAPFTQTPFSSGGSTMFSSKLR
jgi:hypothetical protein